MEDRRRSLRRPAARGTAARAGCILPARAAPVRRPTPRSLRDMPTSRFARVALTAAVLGAGAFVRPAAAQASDAVRARMAAADQARIQGRDDAKLWIIVFSDFQCPFCKRWHDETDAMVRRDYVATGKAKLAFINFPLSSHPFAQPAAEAAMCAAAQGKFWPYHDALFASQARWTGGGDPAPVFDSLATAIGLDVAQFRPCRAERQMKLMVESDRLRGERAGASGTPHFYIGTQQVSGAIPAAQFAKYVDQELAKLGAKK